ncbi:transcriptional regulator [Yinghuangia aomiensis]
MPAACWTGDRFRPRSAARLAAVAGLLADPTRAAICLALVDGRAWTGGELARHAGSPRRPPASTSAAWSRAVCSPRNARGGTGTSGWPTRAPRNSSRTWPRSPDPGATGDHPTGTQRVGRAGPRPTRATTTSPGASASAITDALTTRGLLVQDTGFALTDAGLAWFAAQGIPLTPSRPGRRPLARPCLDWTERRAHLSGIAGAALCTHAFDSGWCERFGSRRAVKVTPRGVEAAAGVPGDRSGAVVGVTASNVPARRGHLFGRTRGGPSRQFPEDRRMRCGVPGYRRVPSGCPAGVRRCLRSLTRADRRFAP